MLVWRANSLLHTMSSNLLFFHDFSSLIPQANSEFTTFVTSSHFLCDIFHSSKEGLQALLHCQHSIHSLNFIWDWVDLWAAYINLCRCHTGLCGLSQVELNEGKRFKDKGGADWEKGWWGLQDETLCSIAEQKNRLRSLCSSQQVCFCWTVSFLSESIYLIIFPWSNKFRMKWTNDLIYRLHRPTSPLVQRPLRFVCGCARVLFIFYVCCTWPWIYSSV